MTHTVESKYKNPDRYIRVLKEQIKGMEKNRDFHAARLGKYATRYNSAVEVDMSITDSTLGVFRANDHVVITARVKRVLEKRDGSEIAIDDVLFRRRDHE